MIRHAARNWVYVGPPKAGCTTMTRLLQVPAFGGVYSGWMHDRPQAKDVPFLFATVRNPFHRAVSLYQHFLYEVVEGPWEIRSRVYSFTRFCIQRLKGRQHRAPFFWQTADHWLGPLEYDAYLPLENLGPALRGLSLNRGYFALPHLNSTRHAPLESYYTPALEKIVREWGEPDFARFGYARELPAAAAQDSSSLTGRGFTR